MLLKDFSFFAKFGQLEQPFPKLDLLTEFYYKKNKKRQNLERSIVQGLQKQSDPV